MPVLGPWVPDVTVFLLGTVCAYYNVMVAMSPIALVVAEAGTDWQRYGDLLEPGTQILRQDESESAGAFLRRIKERLSQWSVLPKRVAWFIGSDVDVSEMTVRAAALRGLVNAMVAEGGGDLRVDGGRDELAGLAARALAEVITEQTRGAVQVAF